MMLLHVTEVFIGDSKMFDFADSLKGFVVSMSDAQTSNLESETLGETLLHAHTEQK